MSATLTAVVGDGTTAASRARQRWRRVRWTLLVLASFALVVAVLFVSRSTGSDTPYAPDSTAPNGSRALARVLERQGVEVTHVTTVDEAVRAAAPGTTLLVAPAPLLTEEQAEVIAAVPADLVLAAPGGTLLDLTTGGDVGLAAVPEAGAREPGCDVAAARAAGDVGLEATLVTHGAAAACWAADGVAVLARVDVDGRTVTAVGDPAFLRNEDVTTQGNAALALGLLGGHERLVWLVQDPFDVSTGTGVEPGAGVLPPWLGPVALWALLCTLVAAAWRARRLGPLVAEELPVVVPAAETTRGRGRLYRRARTRGHAAAALRAATADRTARRLGVPRSADPTTLVDALARATGHPPQALTRLLYGPPPADDAALSALAERLDELESEVHRQ
ncbi:hypothetical protein Xcel_2517 [Xylanimonas cellulosilytica DSM 15894]|uniref:DUF4350 domain-containing protein n=1 Tax=Xylanimonas cellulosilytica (strain DSM 15894 / JCM 12276 / CECT 5975 / KCTC 9989 / LMG 20990 / NBRC 107835 / XIL07) TaxID=446471 RepID=D1BWI7_XYLCX|nr:DUF4350 domain-containing protein [Xylanimonas cellulosilytica]ACZ31532.1 hypothetical protein Xcel_2517 [Xylanimonas cellulosilytica DSM 15894]